MLETLAAAVAPEDGWDALVQAVIEAKANIEPLLVPLHLAEVAWNVERSVAERDKRAPDSELEGAYEKAFAEFEQAKQAVVVAQERMKAGG